MNETWLQTVWIIIWSYSGAPIVEPSFASYELCEQMRGHLVEDNPGLRDNQTACLQSFEPGGADCWESGEKEIPVRCCGPKVRRTLTECEEMQKQGYDIACGVDSDVTEIADDTDN